MFLVTVGLNHRTAPVEIREKVTFPENTLPEALIKLKEYPKIFGCIILSTCNRTEIYAATVDVEVGLNSIKQFLAEWSRIDLCEINNFLYNHTMYGPVHHLFRVASGLDSMILGETQILGQVRVAYQKACEIGTTNRVLNTLFQQAITVGKRVRTETKIDQNAVSVSYAAVELAKNIFGGLEGRTIMILGAGKMSELTAKHLLSNGVSNVTVANRSFDKAVAMAEQFGGHAINYSDLFKHMADVDIVISCTAATHCIILPEDMVNVMEKRCGRTIILIDIAVPRDVDPAVGSIAGVNLYDIDDLQHVVDKNLEDRKKAACVADEIVKEEMDEFLKWLNVQFVTPTVSALKARGEEIKQKELERALNRLGNLSDREKKVIGSLANSIVNQLLHEPITQLKNYALTHQGHMYTEILQNLFSLEVQGQMKKKHPHGEAEVQTL